MESVDLNQASRTRPGMILDFVSFAWVQVCLFNFFLEGEGEGVLGTGANHRGGCVGGGVYNVVITLPLPWTSQRVFSGTGTVCSSYSHQSYPGQSEYHYLKNRKTVWHGLRFTWIWYTSRFPLREAVKANRGYALDSSTRIYTVGYHIHGSVHHSGTRVPRWKLSTIHLPLGRP